jgi:hypothetical protein
VTWATPTRTVTNQSINPRHRSLLPRPPGPARRAATLSRVALRRPSGHGGALQSRRLLHAPRRVCQPAAGEAGSGPAPPALHRAACHLRSPPPATQRADCSNCPHAPPRAHGLRPSHRGPVHEGLRSRAHARTHRPRSAAPASARAQ